jgi:hypothetical protein
MPKSSEALMMLAASMTIDHVWPGVPQLRFARNVTSNPLKKKHRTISAFVGQVLQLADDTIAAPRYWEKWLARSGECHRAIG